MAGGPTFGENVGLSMAASPALRRSRPAFATGAGFLLAAAILTAAPRAKAADPDPDPWFGRDKALHFGVSAGIAAGTYGVGRALVFDKRFDAALVAGGVTLAIGAAKEGYDALGYGDPSWKDFTWDAIGTVTGVAIGLGIDLLITSLSQPAPSR